MKMTPKERVRAAMDLKFADQTPLMCQLSIGHMLRQLRCSPSDFWFDQNTYTDGIIRLREIYDFDGILISLHGHSPHWRENIAQITRMPEKEIIEWLNGDKTIFPNNELPYYQFNKPVCHTDINSFSASGLPDKLHYIPVSNNLRFNIYEGNKFGALETVVEQCGKLYSVHGEITSPFDYFLEFAGYQDALLALLINPEMSKIILAHFTKKVKELAIEMCATGIDAIKISSPFAGSGFISSETYTEFVVPYEKEIACAIREKGIHVYTHTCGSVDDRLELMFDAGISGIECLDPPPLGNVNLSNAFERIGKRGFIKGNIDSVNLLLAGTRDEIVTKVNNILDCAQTWPGFILSTACSIAPEVKRENVQLLRTIIEKRTSDF